MVVRGETCPQERDRWCDVSIEPAEYKPDTQHYHWLCPPPSPLPARLMRDGAEGGRGSKILCQPVQVFVWAKWKNFWINELSFKSWAITVWQRCQKITGVFHSLLIRQELWRGLNIWDNQPVFQDIYYVCQECLQCTVRTLNWCNCHSVALRHLCPLDWTSQHHRQKLQFLSHNSGWTVGLWEIFN